MHSPNAMAKALSALSRFVDDLAKLDRRLVRINAQYARGFPKARKGAK